MKRAEDWFIAYRLFNSYRHDLRLAINEASVSDFRRCELPDTLDLRFIRYHCSGDLLFQQRESHSN